MIDLFSNITAIIMLIGIFVGTLISPRISRQIEKEFVRKDIIFRKKLEYFELILATIEKNKRDYDRTIKKLEAMKKKTDFLRIVKEMKANRRNFLSLSSPLYFNTNQLSEKITRFVRVETEIFNRVNSLENKSKKGFPVLIEELKKLQAVLNERGNEILFEMRTELKR